VSDVSKFPVSHWQRLLNRRGSRTVTCVVSGRYLRFGKLGPPSSGYFPDQAKVGTPVPLDVMASSDIETPDRKICQLIVTLEELRDMVAMLEKEKSDS
jgi:hypothetical protein